MIYADKLKKQLERRAKIYKLIRVEGYSFNQIARQEKISVPSVQRLIKRYEDALEREK